MQNKGDMLQHWEELVWDLEVPETEITLEPNIAVGKQLMVKKFETSKATFRDW